MNEIIPVEYQNQRILTTQQLADNYEVDTRKIVDNFNNNKDRYIESKHYYLLQGDELKAFKSENENFGIADNLNKFYLWTEKGALLHAKSLNTDTAWAVYDTLVENYFNPQKQQSINVTNLSPELQISYQLLAALSKTQEEVKQLEQKTNEVQTALNTIQNTIIQRDDDWRRALNVMFNNIVENSESKDFEKARNYTYRLLEERGGCNLSVRLSNLKGRLYDSGATKTAMNKANKLDVIENDKRLKEIYTSIVKELSIRYAGGFKIVKAN